jgi:hypothetical protein
MADPNKIHSSWHPVKIKLDTGSEFNIISRRVLTRLKFQSGYDEPHFKTAITFDAAHVQEFEERVSLSFTLDMWPYTLYETFNIREGAEIDLLIGHKTISAENLVQIRQDVVNHLRWRNRSKTDREEMEGIVSKQSSKRTMKGLRHSECCGLQSVPALVPAPHLRLPPQCLVQLLLLIPRSTHQLRLLRLPSHFQRRPHLEHSRVYLLQHTTHLLQRSLSRGFMRTLQQTHIHKFPEALHVLHS